MAVARGTRFEVEHDQVFPEGVAVVGPGNADMDKSISMIMLGKAQPGTIVLDPHRKRSTMADGATARAKRVNRRAIPVTCALHKGPRGFANLVVERQGDEIIFDPHVTGGCVIIFDEAAATALFDVLGEWLG